MRGGEQSLQGGTYRNVIECDVCDVVVGAALPGVVKSEAERTGVTAVKSDVLAESAILNVDGPVVYLHSSNGEVPSGERKLFISASVSACKAAAFFFWHNEIKMHPLQMEDTVHIQSWLGEGAGLSLCLSNVSLHMKALSVCDERDVKYAAAELQTQAR